jgi:hypothetical protein
VLSELGAKLVPNQRGESSQRGKNVVVRCARKTRWKGHVRKEARLLELDTPFKLDSDHVDSDEPAFKHAAISFGVRRKSSCAGPSKTRV